MWSAGRCGAGYKRRQSSTTLQLSPLLDGSPFVIPAAIGLGMKGPSNHLHPNPSSNNPNPNPNVNPNLTLPPIPTLTLTCSLAYICSLGAACRASRFA